MATFTLLSGKEDDHEAVIIMGEGGGRIRRSDK